MTASIYVARRAYLTPCIDCWLWIWFKLIHCVFSVIENSNTLNRVLTRRLHANSSDLPYWEHP